MRAVWFTIGSLALALGIIGIVLPVLPTTPFVILAAFCFGKSSPRLRNWLVETRLFGPMIKDWEAHGAIPTKVKAFACTMMLAVLLISYLAGASMKILLIQMIGIGIGASYVLTRPAGPRPME